jgi:hypothetical protein
MLQWLVTLAGAMASPSASDCGLDRRTPNHARHQRYRQSGLLAGRIRPEVSHSCQEDAQYRQERCVLD